MGQPMEINLTGPEGNVFNLIGVGGRLCKLLNINQDKFVREMMSGDYDNAVNTLKNITVTMLFCINKKVLYLQYGKVSETY